MKSFYFLKNVISILYRFMINILNNILHKKIIINNNFIIATIAFNNLETLQLQYINLNKYLKDKFEYVIIDNSNDYKISKEIRKWCELEKILYIKIYFKYNINPSNSHGYALNYAYSILSKTQAKYLGFLDHDIYPYKDTNIINRIKEGVYGHIQNRENIWYLWPGFCFFDTINIKNIKVNFLPVSGLDTGGRLYSLYYKNINKNIINVPIQSNYYIKDKNNNEIIIEKIGDWLHIGKLSNWNKDENKNFLINIIKKLNNYE